MEAPVGLEPTHYRFADGTLTSRARSLGGSGGTRTHTTLQSSRFSKPRTTPHGRFHMADSKGLEPLHLLRPQRFRDAVALLCDYPLVDT